MLRITLSKAGEPPKTSQFDKREITVGRTSSNDLMIPEPGVSSSHARILYMDGELTLIDLESTNGTFVNGKRIQGPQAVRPLDEVYICAHKLMFELAGGAQQPEPASAPAQAPSPVVAVPVAAAPAPAPAAPAPPPAVVVRPAAPPMAPGAPPSLGAPNLSVPSAVAGVGGRVPAKQPGEPTFPPLLAPNAPAPAAAAPGPRAMDSPAAAPPPVEPMPSSPLDAEEGTPEPVSIRSGDTVPPSQGVPAESLPPSVPPPPPPSLLAEPLGGGRNPPSFYPTEPPPTRNPAEVEPASPPSASPPSALPPSVAPAEASPSPSSTPGPAPAAPLAAAPAASSAPSRAPALAAKSKPKPPNSVAPAPRPKLPGRAARPPLEQSARGSRPPQALYEPSDGPVASTPPSSTATLGDLGPLQRLEGDARVAEVCARVFALAYGSLATHGLLRADDRPRAEALVRTYLERLAVQVDGIDVDYWTDRLADELTSVGPVAGPLGDESVEEIILRGPKDATVRRGGKSQVADVRYSCSMALDQVVRRLTGCRFDANTPVVDDVAADGTEVYAVHSSVSREGPVVTLRPGAAKEVTYSLERMLQGRVMTPKLANFLSSCIQGGLNIAICAGPGARGLEMLGALAQTAPRHERQVLVTPRAPGPGLPPSIITLRPGHASLPAHSMSSLVSAAAGLQPDRLLVHDVAGDEAAAVFAAMGRVGGTVLTTRAGTSQEGFQRLCALLTMAESGDSAPRATYVAGSLELIVTLARFADGQTRVTQISEPCLSPAGTPQVVDLLTMDLSTRGWTHTGAHPTFAAELRRRGIVVDLGDAPPSDRTQMAPGSR